MASAPPPAGRNSVANGPLLHGCLNSVLPTASAYAASGGGRRHA